MPLSKSPTVTVICLPQVALAMSGPHLTGERSSHCFSPLDRAITYYLSYFERSGPTNGRSFFFFPLFFLFSPLTVDGTLRTQAPGSGQEARKHAEGDREVTRSTYCTPRL
jgi:hypothetical protein